MGAWKFVIMGMLLLIVGGIIFGVGWFGYGDLVWTYYARVGWRIAGVVIGSVGFASVLAGFIAVASGTERR